MKNQILGRNLEEENFKSILYLKLICFWRRVQMEWEATGRGKFVRLWFSPAPCMRQVLKGSWICLRSSKQQPYNITQKLNILCLWGRLGGWEMGINYTFQKVCYLQPSCIKVLFFEKIFYILFWTINSNNYFILVCSALSPTSLIACTHHLGKCAHHKWHRQ